MLVLSRKSGESLFVDCQCGRTQMWFTVRGNRIKVAVDAPAKVKIFRPKVAADIDRVGAKTL